VTKDSPWENVTTFKHHYLSFPFYPFRTLAPRDLIGLKLNKTQHEFDSSSPIIPANTQINCVFTRRNIKKLINYLLPFNLDMELGTSLNQLTAEKRKTALTFTTFTPVAGAQPTRHSYVISDVSIVINDMYLQVPICWTINIISISFTFTFIPFNLYLLFMSLGDPFTL
jgi:hypothetical protein